jgi:acyl phosphate:glycerol-3-phosphate acyltransferase
LMAMNPWLGVATLLSWALIAGFSRYSSLASIVAAAFAPFYQALIWGVDNSLLALVLMSLLLIWRHEANIHKLLAGTESKLGQKTAAKPGAAAWGASSPAAHPAKSVEAHAGTGGSAPEPRNGS